VPKRTSKGDDVEGSRASKRKNDDDDESAAANKRLRASRYERNSSSAIYMAFNKFKAFRRTAQQMILMRDGADLRNGATDRILNVLTILEASKKDIPFQEHCNLESAFKTSMKDPKDG
jgi:hypothetical protein